MTQPLGPEMAEQISMCQLFFTFWPLLLGNVLEWYDFGVYSFLAPNMKEIFFHSSSVSTWAGYGVTFVLRPFGGLLNGWLADKYGRRVAVLTSIVGMLVATFGQGLLPTFQCCGDGWGTFGLVVLLVLRALQGLSAGGELGPIVSYFAETAPPNRIRAATGLLLSSAGLGFLSANLLVVLVVHLVGPHNMTVWGWRIPFLVSLLPGSIALWGRSKLAESADFVRLVIEREDNLAMDGEQQGRLKDHGRAVLIGFLSTCSVAVSYYSGLWCPSYLKSVGLDETFALLASCGFICVAMVSWLVWPLVNDVFFRIDPIKIVFGGGLGVAVAGFPVWYLLSTSSNLKVTSMVVLAIYGLVVGIAGSHLYIFVADLFPIHLRALGFGMSLNVAFAFVGGSAPLINSAILETEWALGVGVYWMLMGLITSLAAAWGICSRRSGELPSHLLGCKKQHAKSYVAGDDLGDAI